MSDNFIRLDTGKFKTHASVPFLLSMVSIHSCDNIYYNIRQPTLINIIELWEIFKQDPIKDNLLQLIHLYARYIDTIDKEKVQSFSPKFNDKNYTVEEIFSILYENHTIVTQKGAEKYPMGNWLKMQPSEVVRCIEPCERHMIYYPLVKGEIVDSENGLPHYMPTIWNLVAIYRVMLIDEEVCRKAILGEKQ